ncbi:MAG: hypothetical protein ABIK44_08140, partial [candidate division WOR-3 bacterium]
QELLGRKLPRRLALLPPVILDTISSDITLQGGNDVLATYTADPTPPHPPQGLTGEVHQLTSIVAMPSRTNATALIT